MKKGIAGSIWLMTGMAVLGPLFGARGAVADGSLNSALTEGLQAGRQPAVAPGETVTIYAAKKIVTMESSNPVATAVAVAGKRILAVGSLEDVKAALGDRKYTTNDTFKEKIILPGLIDQHLHPILGALTLATEVIAT